MPGSKGPSNSIDSTSPCATSTSAKESLINAMYDIEREAKLDLFNDEFFITALEKILAKVLEPIVQRLLEEQLTKSHPQSQAKDEDAIDSAQIIKYQKHQIGILNQHRSDLCVFGTNLLQQMETLRQTMYLSQSVMPAFALDDPAAKENIAQPQHTPFDTNAAFHGG